MSADEIRRGLRVYWRNFTQLFWPQTPRERVQSELALLDEELRQRQERLFRRRQRIEELRYRIARRERRLEALAARAQETLARPEDEDGRLAVAALEAGRQVVECLLERLAGREQQYERQRVRFDLLKRRRAEVWKLLLAGPADRFEEEEGPDYPC